VSDEHEAAHVFKGRHDRWCEVCNKPDRHSIHIAPPPPPSSVLPNLAGLLARTTPGPWKHEEDSEEGGWVAPHGAFAGNEPDTSLIAAAPVLAQALIDAGDALTLYGKHSLSCPCSSWSSAGSTVPVGCDCGLDAVLVRLADIDKDIGQ
jgi:hypothetical protein